MVAIENNLSFLRLLFQEEVGAVPEADSPEDDPSYGTTKDTEKLKMMLLAWNASGTMEKAKLT